MERLPGECAPTQRPTAPARCPLSRGSWQAVRGTPTWSHWLLEGSIW